MNKVHLTGRVTREVILKTTSKGQKMTMNTICVQRPFKDVDGKYGVDYIDFSLFDGKAESFVEYVKKGDFIEITGRLHQNPKEKEGIKIYNLELIVENIGYCFGGQKVVN